MMHLLAEKVEKNEEVALITVITSNRWHCRLGDMMLVDKNGVVLGGSIGGGQLEKKAIKEAQTCIERGVSRKVLLTEEGESVEIFINAFCYFDKLIIVGSGSVALNIYKVAMVLGYRITVVDNRTETLTEDRFPGADKLLLGDIVENLSLCDIDENTSIVIATHHHKFDEPALKAVIHSPARYIGILSNRRKAASYFDNLRAQGIPDNLLNRVYTPIGLDLGGKKTPEIAVAVMAEILAVKYGRSGGFCRDIIKEGRIND